MNDLYQRITDQIIAALEAGTPPWIRPWKTSGDAFPTNHFTNRAYRGINVLTLNLTQGARGYARNRWLTFRQAHNLGGHVRKGETGTPITFYRLAEVPEADRDTPEGGSARVVPMLRCFTVFNIEQVEGLAAEQSEDSEPWNSHEVAETIIDASGAAVHHGGSRAYYQLDSDHIQLPPRSSFGEASAYYAVALHELTHWTGHPSRCNRPLGRRHGIDAYAFEELIAEIGAAFLCAHCRLPGRIEHASYIESWLQALRNDKRLIFVASGKAQAAADYVLSAVAPTPEATERVAEEAA